MQARNRTKNGANSTQTSTSTMSNTEARAAIVSTMLSLVGGVAAILYFTAIVGVLFGVYKAITPVASTVARMGTTSFNASWYNAEVVSTLLGVSFCLAILGIHLFANNDNFNQPLEMALSIGVLGMFLIGGWIAHSVTNVSIPSFVLESTGMDSLGFTFACLAGVWFIIDITTDFKSKFIG